jgi:hypothetical protein
VKGVPFSLSSADISIPKYCPVLGIELRVNERHVGPDSPSIDRIIPELGYVPGNVIVVSHLANTIKSYATVDQLLRVAAFYQQLIPPTRGSPHEATRMADEAAWPQAQQHPVRDRPGPL